MPVLALLLAATLSAAAPADLPLEAPGLDVEDRCTAAGLTASGFTGAIRIRQSEAADRSMKSCDAALEAREVRAFRVTARPCLGLALRQYGYVGRLFTPEGMIATPEETACEAGREQSAQAEPAQSELATFVRADGKEVTTMRPVPNPEDMPIEERQRVYGYQE